MKKTIHLTEKQLQNLIFEAISDFAERQSYIDEINEEFYRNVFVEFYYNNENKCLLEHIDKTNIPSKQYGIFMGYEGIIEDMYDKAVNAKPGDMFTIPVDQDQVHWIRNVEMRIILDDKDVAKGYLDEELSKYVIDNNEYVYDPAVIVFNYAKLKLTYQSFYGIAAHELNHAYDEWNRKNGNKKTFVPQKIRPTLPFASHSIGLNKYCQLPHD